MIWTVLGLKTYFSKTIQVAIDIYLITTPEIIVPWRKARFFMIGWKMNDSERSAKVETYLSPKSMLCAWMTPEGDIRISLIRIERIDCSSQIVQRKEQIIISEEELSALKRFFPVIDQFVYFQRFKFIRNVSQQARSISSRTSLCAQTSTRNSDGSKQQWIARWD